jgi:hypothetical protein
MADRVTSLSRLEATADHDHAPTRREWRHQRQQGAVAPWFDWFSERWEPVLLIMNFYNLYHFK